MTKRKENTTTSALDISMLTATRKQYYFSELNERSIALAKSIINKETKLITLLERKSG